MRVFHEAINEEVKIKKIYDHGVCSCYLVNLPKVYNTRGKLVYQTIVTNVEKLVRIGNENLEIFANNC